MYLNSVKNNCIGSLSSKVCDQTSEFHVYLSTDVPPLLLSVAIGPVQCYTRSVSWLEHLVNFFESGAAEDLRARKRNPYLKYMLILVRENPFPFQVARIPTYLTCSKAAD